MGNERKLRLIQVAKEFKVGLNTVTDFLQKKGIKSDGSPNTLVDAETYAVLEKEFGANRSAASARDSIRERISLKQTTVTLEEARKQEREEEKEVVIKSNVISVKDEIQQPKFLGKIDLSPKPKAAPAPQPKPAPEAEAQVKTALTYSASVTGQRWARARWYGFVALTFSCVLAALICFICEFAISQSLTWSLIVFASLVLGWGILAPLLVAGKKRFQKSLLALTILIFPYLGVLSGLVAPGRVVFRLGSAVSAVSLAYLWLGFLLFSRLRGHRWSAVGVLALLAFPHTMAVNAFIPYFLPGETSTNNILVNLFACLLLAALCFGADVMIALGRRKGF